MILHIDFETRSRCDIKKSGGHRYAWDASTEVLCLAIAEGDNEPLVYVPDKFNRKLVNYRYDEADEALDLLEAACHPDAIIYAHNSSGFEVPVSDALWHKTFGTRAPAHSQWRCTAAMGRRAALPSSLEKLAETLKLGNLKDHKGKSLIRKFCIPQTSGKRKGEFIDPQDEPELFQAFCEYCRQDVKVEQDIHKKLKDFELTGFALQTFLLDLEINTRGFPVNLEALRKAEKLVNEETERLSAEFREITGFAPTQNKRFLEWLNNYGFLMDNLRAETMDEVLEDAYFDESTPMGRALTIKKRVSFASLKKIPSMIGCAGPHDNRVRGTLLYHGAGTGRWSAKLVQPQNFKRPAPYMEFLSEKAYKDIAEGCSVAWLDLAYGPPLEVVSSCIRHFIDNGTPMLDADYSAIEARIIAWQAQEKWRLDVFKTHGKIYEASASMMFKVPFSEFEEYASRGKKHPLRHKGKVAELACGFGGGPAALERMGALKQGLTKEELPDIITQWREANPAVVTHWRTTEDAAKNAIRTPGKMFMFGIDCCFFTAKTAGMNYLFMRLPSGRKLTYPQPELTPHLSWWEEKIELVDDEDENGNPVKIKKVVKGDAKKMLNPTPEQIAKVKAKYPKARMGESITFFGQIPMTTRWGRISTYGGSLVENATQAIAADFMACGALNATKHGYNIVALIHDEALSEYEPEKGQTSEEFVRLLTELPPWAEGMPLAAEGDIVQFYKK